MSNELSLIKKEVYKLKSQFIKSVRKNIWEKYGYKCYKSKYFIVDYNEPNWRLKIDDRFYPINIKDLGISKLRFNLFILPTIKYKANRKLKIDSLKKVEIFSKEFFQKNKNLNRDINIDKVID